MITVVLSTLIRWPREEWKKIFYALQNTGLQAQNKQGGEMSLNPGNYGKIHKSNLLLKKNVSKTGWGNGLRSENSPKTSAAEWPMWCSRPALKGPLNTAVPAVGTGSPFAFTILNSSCADGDHWWADVNYQCLLTFSKQSCWAEF